jgi:hypothetical protein
MKMQVHQILKKAPRTYSNANGTTWSEIKKINGRLTAASQDFFGLLRKHIDGDYAIVWGVSGKDYDSKAPHTYTKRRTLFPPSPKTNYNKLTLNSLNDIQSSRLTLNSNTYTANGPVSKFFVNEAGTYEVSAAGSDAYAIVKKTVAAPITLNEADIARNDYTQADTTEQKIQASDATSSTTISGGPSV